MSNDELFKAFGAFNQGLQSYAISSALKDATSQVNQLNAQAIKDTEKNAQLQALGNQLALQLGGLGAPVSQIQSAVGAILPQQDATIQQGLLSPYAPNQDRAKAAWEMQQQAEERQLARREQMQLNAEGRQEARMNRLMDRRADVKEQTLKPIPTKQQDELINAQVGLSDLNDIRTQVTAIQNSVGPIAARNPLRQFIPDQAAFEMQVNRMFDAYRVAVTGAAASEKEMEALRKSTLQSTDTLPVFLKKLERAETIVKRHTGARLETLKRAKIDVSGFENMFDSTSAQGSSAAPAPAAPMSNFQQFIK